MTLDDDVLARLAGSAAGLTLGDLAAAAGERRAVVKACLRRLRRRGLVSSRAMVRVEEYLQGPSATRVVVGYFVATEVRR